MEAALASEATESVAVYEALAPDVVCERLAAAGFRFVRGDVQIEPRDGRWLVRLPGQLMAWFAATEYGAHRLETERRVLRLLDRHCLFRVPRVLYVDEARGFEVRTMVAGEADPRHLYEKLRHDVEFASALGNAVGRMLAEQHSRIHAADVADWLPHRPAWPRPGAWIRECLPRVVEDPQLIARALAVIDAYEDLAVSEADRALVHGDLGLHNLAVDAASHEVCGIFDYDGTAWADRHHDFRYLVFDFGRDQLFEAARSTYERITKQRIDRDRVLLYNAACAITFLAYRAGTRPEDESCGRTLAQDLEWSRAAIAKALRPSGRASSADAHVAPSASFR